MQATDKTTTHRPALLATAAGENPFAVPASLRQAQARAKWGSKARGQRGNAVPKPQRKGRVRVGVWLTIEAEEMRLRAVAGRLHLPGVDRFELLQVANGLAFVLTQAGLR